MYVHIYACVRVRSEPFAAFNFLLSFPANQTETVESLICSGDAEAKCQMTWENGRFHLILRRPSGKLPYDKMQFRVINLLTSLRINTSLLKIFKTLFLELHPQQVGEGGPLRLPNHRRPP